MPPSYDQNIPKANFDIMHGGMSPTIYLPLPPPNTRPVRPWSKVFQVTESWSKENLIFFTPLLVGGANMLIQFCFIMVGLWDEKNLIKLFSNNGRGWFGCPTCLEEKCQGIWWTYFGTYSQMLPTSRNSWFELVPVYTCLTSIAQYDGKFGFGGLKMGVTTCFLSVYGMTKTPQSMDRRLGCSWTDFTWDSPVITHTGKCRLIRIHLEKMKTCRKQVSKLGGRHPKIQLVNYPPTIGGCHGNDSHTN